MLVSSRRPSGQADPQPRLSNPRLCSNRSVLTRFLSLWPLGLGHPREAKTIAASFHGSMGVSFSGVLDRDVNSKCSASAFCPSSQTIGADPLIPSILFHVSCKVPKVSGGNNAGGCVMVWLNSDVGNLLTRTWTALVVVHLIPHRCQQRRMRVTPGPKILKLHLRSVAQRALMMY